VAERLIFHVDLDAFFVAVERLRDPSLNGKPVIVGHPGNRGVVATASYEARKFGVHSAMPMVRARRLCPSAIIVPPDFSLYSEHSRRFRTALDEFSPEIEQTSIDEAYLDMTGAARLFGPPEAAARRLKGAVLERAGVTASVGGGTNKLIAKVATDACKPDGLLIVPAGREAAFLAPMPVRKLPGLGPKTEAKLATAGIATLGQLAACAESDLRPLLGPHAAAWLRHRASGADQSPVITNREAKSISNETTFATDISDR
jgi:DNA polymerase-4